MKHVVYTLCTALALCIAGGCTTSWLPSTVQQPPPTAAKRQSQSIATNCETRTSQPTKSAAEPAEPPSHVTIRLHHNTFTPGEQWRRVADVIDHVRRNGIRNVTFYVEPDTDTPQDAVDRVLTQLRRSGFKEGQIKLNPHQAEQGGGTVR